VCSSILGDHGAEVIKVESLLGDETRKYGPPFIDGESTYFMNINRSKRSISVDLNTPQGRDIVTKLAVQSDVLIENFKKGTVERWRLDYDNLKSLNSKLIYLSISGYGRSGPYGKVAGYDGAIQAFSGFMSINGDPRVGPVKAGIAIADLITGMTGVQAVLLALVSRASSGQGQHAQVSLLHSILSLIHPHNANFLNAGVVGEPHGNTHPMIAPYDLFTTSDGAIYLTSGNDEQFTRLMKALKADACATDERFQTNALRVKNREHLVKTLQKIFSTESSRHWCELLWAVDVAVGPVNSLRDVFKDSHVKELELVAKLTHSALSTGSFKSITPPIGLSETPAALRRPPPMLGEHTTEVLQELGYSRDKIDDLLGAGVIRQGRRQQGATLV
jgi:crotonobetainyl-CoA:carnitine CoA-transferase CaiB-like acyl-CoA transferase